MTQIHALLLALLGGWAGHALSGRRRPNVLYVVVDDLRPNLGAYNQTFMRTPHLDALARGALTFDRAYVQIAVCAPSRNSFMSGRRPQTTLSYNFLDDFRRSTSTGSTWQSLPQTFKDAGYNVFGTGKLYHPNLPPRNDPVSWTNCSEQYPAWNGGEYVAPSMAKCLANESWGNGERWCAVSDDSWFVDRNVTDDAIDKLRFLAAQEGTPFFLGVGLRKPHLDWRVPASFLSLYPTSGIMLPKHIETPAGMPELAFHDLCDAKLKQVFPAEGNVTPWQPMHNATALAARQFYYAAVSFMDSQVGRLLDELLSLGLYEDTVVVVHGDHGWSLGEGGMWRKFSNFEACTRIPLIARVPWAKSSHGQHSRALVEAIDVFPTLCALAGVPAPVASKQQPALDGENFSWAFFDPHMVKTSKHKAYAFSQYPRCPAVDKPGQRWQNNWCEKTDKTQFRYMGLSVRTDTWRYTEWRRWNGTALAPQFDIPALGVELYDHTSDAGDNFDSFEVRNEAADLNRHAVVEQLAGVIKVQFDTQVAPAAGAAAVTADTW